MKLIQAVMALVLSAIFLGVVAGVAAANVPGVAINAPPPPPAPNVATAGSDALIKVVLTHRDTGSPALHYVDRVMLYDGDKLLKEWKYDQNSYKTDETWTESLTVPAKADMHLRAVAHCTVHGYDLTGMHVRVLPAGTTPSGMMLTDASSAGMQAFGYARADKASDFISAADTRVLQDNIKAQSGELKSFQTKMSDWMKSTEGKQFIAKFEKTGAPMAAGEMGRQAPAATGAVKPTASATSGSPTPVPGKYTPRYAGESGYKASPTAKKMIAIGDMSDKTSNIPRSTPGPTPFVSVKPSLKASPAKNLIKVKPTASVMPTKKPDVKYLAFTPQGVKSPAESYGIYGFGGPVPTAPKATATVRPVPSGSPTPVPGSYTPRYPGEAGAGKNVTVPPSPTPVPTPGVRASSIDIPYAGGKKTAGGTTGQCACISLANDLRYAGRGPGLVGTTIVQTPASAPGPNSKPTASRVVRT